MDISIVVPVYNEENNILPLYNRLTKVLKETLDIDYEIIYVNNCSEDETENELVKLSGKDKKVKFISFSRNFGYQIGITAGIDHSIGDAVVLIDGDLQDPPELIKDLWEKYSEGYDVVYAKRKKRKGETVFKKITAKIFYRILNGLVSEIRIPKDTGSFRIMSKRVANQLTGMRENNRFIRGLVAWVGFKQTSIDYIREPRNDGETSYSLTKLISFAFDGITSFSTTPLRLAGFAGFGVSILGFIYMIYIVLQKIIFGFEVSGWSSLMVVTLFLGGINLITLGLIGEYIGRIFTEAKDRPLYIIDKKVNIDGNKNE